MKLTSASARRVKLIRILPGVDLAVEAMLDHVAACVKAGGLDGFIGESA